ncbi:HesB/IscA family protein [Microbacterium radiodurans]|uniref:Fe-S cluster assembly protein HesB n=1 Tax=Microbacterium radiodurans TaxID=661398 RepID=A0A5J5IPM3_9MICO|nr:Fe-S cluster assembly protein HesB [Microbacterium radiodurans]KAA9085412.1 Fe-S cluster assembly protein HesB [Microbacterium radiodurans]
MLTLTENAATAVKNLTAQIPADTGGIRISDSGSPETGFALSLAEAPHEADSVVEADGARIFVDQAAAVALDDRVLDAQVDSEGGVSFALGVRG